MWGLVSHLGDRAEQVLEDHYKTWIIEDNVQKMYEAGINTLRIGMGYWSWMKVDETEP